MRSRKCTADGLFKFRTYSGTVAEMADACPMFRMKLNKGVDAAMQWLEKYDGVGVIEEQQHKKPEEEPQPMTNEEQQLASEPEPEPEPAEKAATIAEEAKHETQQVSSVEVEDSVDEIVETESRLEAARQEVAEVFADIEVDSQTDLYSDKDKESVTVDTRESVAESSEVVSQDASDAEIADEVPMQREIEGVADVEETHEVTIDTDADADEVALPAAESPRETEMRTEVTPRHDEDEHEAPELVTEQNEAMESEMDIERTTLHDEEEELPAGSLVEEMSESLAVEREAEMVVEEFESASKSDSEVDILPDQDSPNLTLAQIDEEPLLAVEQIADTNVAETTTAEHEDAYKVDETIAYIHSLVEEDADTTQETKVGPRTYVDVLNQAIPEIEAVSQEQLDVEAVPLVTQEQQETLDEMRPEAQAEVYAVATRAEQATAKLMHASTEAECHEARQTMTEEIVTLLELLGYDNPQEVMVDILKTYDIGELRELLQHFLASSRIPVYRKHDLLSRLSSYIAARAIFVHGYEASYGRVA